MVVSYLKNSKAEEYSPAFSVLLLNIRIKCRLFFLKEHWIPGRKHDWLLLEHVEELLIDLLLVDYKTEHVLIEPLIGHDHVATIA